MMELIFVLLIIGALLFFLYTKLAGGYSRTQASTVLSNDVDAVIAGALNYKASSPNSGDTFQNLDGDELLKYMTVDKVTGDTTTNPHSVKSRKFAGCRYYVAPFAGDFQFKMLVDCSTEKANAGWDTRKTELLEEKIAKYVQDRSSTPVTIDYTATAIGNANAALTAGGTADDAIVGITGIGG